MKKEITITPDNIRQAIEDLLDENIRLKEEYVLLQNASGKYEDEMEEKIDIMQRYFQMIIDLGFDYDGCNTIEGLKMLIDELVRYARVGKNCDIVETVYVNESKKYNILGEEIDYESK